MEVTSQRSIQENDPPLNPIHTPALFERAEASTLTSQAASPEETPEAEPSVWWVWTCKGWEFLYWIVSFAVDWIFCRPLMEASKGIDQQTFREQTSLISARVSAAQPFLPPERQIEVFSRLPYAFQKEVFDYLQIGTKGNRVEQAIQHERFITYFPILADRFSGQLLLAELKKLLPKLSGEEPLDNLELFQALCSQNREQLAMGLVDGSETIQAKLTTIAARPERYMRKVYFSKCLKTYQAALTDYMGGLEGKLFPERVKKPKTVD